MLLQMFELLNKLEDAGATGVRVSFDLTLMAASTRTGRAEDAKALRIKITAPTADGVGVHNGRTLTGEELMSIAIDGGGVLDRMSKAFLIDLNNARKKASQA